MPASRIPDEVVEPLIQQVMNAPQEQLLSVGAEFRMQLDKREESFAARACDLCGDMVVEKYLRVLGDQRVCVPCQEKAL